MCVLGGWGGGEGDRDRETGRERERDGNRKYAEEGHRTGSIQCVFILYSNFSLLLRCNFFLLSFLVHIKKKVRASLDQFVRS